MQLKTSSPSFHNIFNILHHTSHCFPRGCENVSLYYPYTLTPYDSLLRFCVFLHFRWFLLVFWLQSPWNNFCWPQPLAPIFVSDSCCSPLLLPSHLCSFNRFPSPQLNHPLQHILQKHFFLPPFQSKKHAKSHELLGYGQFDGRNGRRKYFTTIA